jgi:hypothetical protein
VSDGAVVAHGAGGDLAEARSTPVRVEQEDVDQTLPQIGGHDVERRERS